jgi:hypothetical protein
LKEEVRAGVYSELGAIDESALDTQDAADDLLALAETEDKKEEDEDAKEVTDLKVAEDGEIILQSVHERCQRQVVWHLDFVEDLDREEDMDEVLFYIDPNFVQVPEVEMMNKEDRIRVASAMLAEASAIAAKANRKLCDAERMRMHAYQLLGGLTDPVVSVLLGDVVGARVPIEAPLQIVDVTDDKDDVEVVQVVEGMDLSDMPALEGEPAGVVESSGSDAESVDSRPDEGLDIPIDSDVEVVTLDVTGRSGALSRSVRIPRDFPDVWPPVYNPKYLGRKGGRDYLCTFPECSSIISRKDPAWTHVAREHTKKAAQCPGCGATYQCPASMREHMRDYH